MRVPNILLGFAVSALSMGSSASADQIHEVRYQDNGAGDLQVVGESSFDSRKSEPLSEYEYPRFIEEHKPASVEKIVVLRSSNRAEIDAELARRQVAPQEPSMDFADEVITLVDNGPSANRIDVTFMGDGYTIEERDLFFQDMQRMVNDMFRDRTFKSYLPLFNVHAVFRPSNESGIGKNDRPKDTAYRLYRAGNTLRAIYPSNSSAARNSCNQAPGCDYPVIIANDPYYGGLGGEFAISTSSITSGTVVLRHELGHNFGRVGEEYDGGGYFGANHSSSVSRLSWNHWATEKNVTAEPSNSRFVAWPWKNLSGGPFTANLSSDGNYASWQLRFSASGLDTEGSLSIMLDGQEVPFISPGTNDRSFHTYKFDSGFTAGSHKIVFSELENDGDNWMSSINIQEYGANYHFDEEFIGAFPLYDANGRVDGYRSNHETCLMRNMESTRFCSICQENNWLNFFAKVDLIDSLTSEVDPQTGEVKAVLATQQLGQLRTDGLDDGSVLEVTWLRDGTVVESLANQVSWTLPARNAAGSWEARVKFFTPEVRKDPRNLLSDTARINL